MPAFRVSGSTGQAPTTVWFGHLPDQYNMLVPLNAGIGFEFSVTVFAAANFANLWVPNNDSFGGGPNRVTLSFGGFTTAPDGTTNTAQQLVDTTANTNHFCTAGWLQNVFFPGTYRLAGFFKNAGRRVCLQLGTPANQARTDQIGQAVYAVFDLAGGQVGTTGAINNISAFSVQAFTLLGQGMIPYGNSWYLCFIDVQYVPPLTFGSSNGVMAYIYLDNGTGTAARSTTYAGDGTSGVYGWRTNVMPPRAYALNNVPFFDDFTSLSTIDINNTKAPGFNWYVNGSWLPFSGGSPPVTKPSFFSQAGSTMTITSDGSPQGGAAWQICTAAQLGGSGSTAFVGQAFKMPMMVEWKWAFSMSAAKAGGPWAVSQPLEGNTASIGSEFDFGELAATGAGFIAGNNSYEQTTHHAYGAGADASIINAQVIALAYQRPVQIYQSSVAYQTAVVTASGGIFYQASQNVPINTPPPNGTYWNVIAQPTSAFYPWFAFDPTVLHTTGVLLLPYAAGDFGGYYTWWDGVFQNVVSVWAPNIGSVIGSMTIQPARDGLPLTTQDGQPGNAGDYASYDFVRITQQ